MSYSLLEQRIKAWAAEEPGVLALLVIGSRARSEHPADSWSDLDLILVAADPLRYVTDVGWLQIFGRVWLQVLNHTGAGDPEWMIVFEGGLKVDFILTPEVEQNEEFAIDNFYAGAVGRGCRVLLNKRGHRFAPSPGNVIWKRPTAEDFSALCHQSWLSAYRVAQMLLRDELWRARMIMDGPLRQQLLLLLEWHAKAIHGSDYDAWADGRFLAEWLAPELAARFALLGAPYDQKATKQALAACLSLVDTLGQELAQVWEYVYPIPSKAGIRKWILLSLEGN